MLELAENVGLLCLSQYKSCMFLQLLSMENWQPEWGRLGNLFLLNGHKLQQLEMDMPASWDWSRIEKEEQ